MDCTFVFWIALIMKFCDGLQPMMPTVPELAVPNRSLVTIPLKFDGLLTSARNSLVSGDKNRKKPSLIDRQIIGGWEVQSRTAIPWQVFVEVQLSYLCGGALISDVWVLTASHCLHGFSKFKVVLGALQRSNVAEQDRLTLVPIQKILHENFDRSLLRNDIGLLQLPCKLRLPGTYYNAVRLPSFSHATILLDMQIGLACGWGRTISGTVSDVLRCTNLTLVNNAVCTMVFGQYMTTSNLCANTNTIDGPQSTCNGDSGGPLVVNELDGHYTLVGVTSFGSASGCTVLKPVVFTRVASHLNWIEQNTNISIRP